MFFQVYNKDVTCVIDQVSAFYTPYCYHKK